MSVLLGIILAVGTWITLTTMFGKSKPDSSPVAGQGVGGGIVQNFGVKDEILFLEVSILLFIIRSKIVC
jgi:H+-transporting ATPase